MQCKSPLVEGKIVFDQYAKSFSHGTVYIYLEDVSMADVLSKVICEDVIADVNYDATSNTTIDFGLYGKIPNYQARYAVRVHVDIDRDGKVTKGDFINMESYYVITHGNPNNVSVHVRQIK